MYQRGAALLTVILVMTLLLPLAAHSILQAHIDLLIARNLRDQTDALYVAEGGLEHALAIVTEGTSPRELLTGPDNTSGTADDGELGFGSIDLGEQRHASSRALRLSADRIEIISIGQAKNGSRRTMAAILVADPVPLTPATLLLASRAQTVAMDPARILIRGDVSPLIAAVSLAADIAPMRRRAFHLPTLRQHLLAANSATYLSGATAPIQMGSRAAPQLTVAEHDLVVPASSTGAGILLVDGSLRITGNLRFEGLVLVMGGIDLDARAEIYLSGSLWQGSSSESVVLAGRGTLEYSSSSLALAETAAPDHLPHLWTVLGRYEPS